MFLWLTWKVPFSYILCQMVLLPLFWSTIKKDRHEKSFNSYTELQQCSLAFLTSVIKWGGTGGEATEKLKPLKEKKYSNMLWQKSWSVLQRMFLPFYSQVTITFQLGTYPEETLNCEDTCTAIFTIVLLTSAKTWQQPKCPLTDEWINRM